MTTSRVSSNAAVGLISWDLARNSQKLTRIQDQIASGKRLQRPSDDPAGTAAALQNRAQISRTEQQNTNASDASSWLNLADSALVTFQTQLSVARERAVQTVNGSMDGVAREGLANDIDGIRSNLLQLANTSYQGRSVFAGTVAAGTPAYDSQGQYLGDDGAVRRNVADGVTLQVNSNGPDVFGARDATNPLNGDVFQVLGALAAAVRANDQAAVGQAMDMIDAASQRTAVVQTKVGAMSQQVDTITNRNEDVLQDAKARLSNLEDVDIAESIIQFRVQENAYNAALGVTAKVIQPSLMDFLR